jgi:glycosyltransferase involved in cell wall biosynthesis
MRRTPYSLSGRTPLPANKITSAPDTVAIVGAINSDKGYDVLLACARDAAQRQLALRFAVVGFTQDDGALLKTGRVRISGEYDENEAAGLLAATGARVGWIPSVCPETWSYALSRILSSGLLPVAFDIGTPAERIRALEEGVLMPLDFDAGAINDTLLLALEKYRATSHGTSDAGVYQSIIADYYGTSLTRPALTSSAPKAQRLHSRTVERPRARRASPTDSAVMYLKA